MPLPRYAPTPTRSLFEKDKLLFAFLLASRIRQAKGALDSSEWMFLLTGGLGGGELPPNPAPAWLMDSSWRQVCQLSSLPNFSGRCRARQALAARADQCCWLDACGLRRGLTEAALPAACSVVPACMWPLLQQGGAGNVLVHLHRLPSTCQHTMTIPILPPTPMLLPPQACRSRSSRRPPPGRPSTTQRSPTQHACQRTFQRWSASSGCWCCAA